jgi:hypothetical protein
MDSNPFTGNFKITFIDEKKEEFKIPNFSCCTFFFFDDEPAI